MNGRRTLGELLGELAGGVTGFVDSPFVRARSLLIDLPIDLRLVLAPDGPIVIGDVPLFLTRTAFDPDPARLQIEWQAVPTEAQP
ncbi:hypothetical protein [Allosphingosinicella deserti]|uniref:Uncharacterized protein n=1 Tax=Allosphingosinicella deserti TaxID=2116704 RepID=A0A2P7QS93_9SPHN|nr:hypothetical protein [Sphingomonas deserti]PSJ40834.1 hypothetical protein C7I55_11145 [Sphingomonas deserti]